MKNTITFSNIQTVNELIDYLDSKDRTKNDKYFYHYTTINTLEKICETKFWRIGSARNMNDLVEYENGCKDSWETILFSCFMREDEENIGMWSMYAQPWKDGVKIAIDAKKMKTWIKEIKEVYYLADKNKPDYYEIYNHDFKISISAVAYFQTQSNDISMSSLNQEYISWSNLKNYKMKYNDIKQYTTGYIKDNAWSYEKEIRLKVKLNEPFEYDYIAIKIPDDIIDSLIITTSPLFDKTNYEKLSKLNTLSSKFEKKLNIKDSCNSCKHKNT